MVYAQYKFMFHSSRVSKVFEQSTIRFDEGPFLGAQAADLTWGNGRWSSSVSFCKGTDSHDLITKTLMLPIFKVQISGEHKHLVCNKPPKNLSNFRQSIKSFGTSFYHVFDLIISKLSSILWFCKPQTIILQLPVQCIMLMKLLNLPGIHRLFNQME